MEEISASLIQWRSVPLRVVGLQIQEWDKVKTDWLTIRSIGAEKREDLMSDLIGWIATAAFAVSYFAANR
jgi:hypothetical protein